MSKNRKQLIISFINKYIKDNGFFPTLDEIKSGVGLNSVSTVHQHIKDLLKEGSLEQDELGGYKLAEKPNTETKDVLIVGKIAAGRPIEAIENHTDCIQIANLPTNSDFYALQVVGDSMIDEGIFDGDIVVIKKQTSAENGQTVVAIIDDNQATLKKLYREKNRFRLEPRNQTMLPLFRNEVEVRGVVWQIISSFNDAPKRKSKIVPTKNWRSVDLFAGVGGIRLGFEKAGFKTVFANDV